MTILDYDHRFAMGQVEYAYRLCDRLANPSRLAAKMGLGLAVRCIPRVVTIAVTYRFRYNEIASP